MSLAWVPLRRATCTIPLEASLATTGARIEMFQGLRRDVPLGLLRDRSRDSAARPHPLERTSCCKPSGPSECRAPDLPPEALDGQSVPEPACSLGQANEHYYYYYYYYYCSVKKNRVRAG